MKYSEEYQDRQIINGLVKKIKEIKLPGKVNIMEVCGTHTMSIFENGIKSLLPGKIQLVSGPGCPVCVTPQSYINKAISLAGKENVIITTFADLLQIPGKSGSLQKEMTHGGDIRTVYSPLEAVDIASKNPDLEVIFLAIGFETTIPTIALSVNKANKLDLNNYYLLQSLKMMPPVLKHLLRDEKVKIDGFILPGHVSSVIGSKAFDFLSKEYNIPGVVTGFEAGDIIMGLYRLCTMLKNNKVVVENLYSRLVNYHGNEKALAVIDEVFRTVDSCWRGLGMIMDSGLELKEEYIKFSAEKRFQFEQKHNESKEECICGEILKGEKEPTDCRLFSSACTPLKPVGPCMVSREGTCAAYYRYRGRRQGRMY